jgi:sialic acid synthase SpsE
MAFYFYTETAFHHEGDWDYLIKLIDASKRVGAQGVKFQVIMDIDKLTSSKHALYPKLQSCVFSKEEWEKAFNYCQENGLDVIMMPLDLGSFDLIKDGNTKISYLDLHSVSFYDQIILDKIKQSEIPLMIGVGGRSIDEINEKRSFFGDQLKVLMVGFQSYPSKLEDVKLGRIQLYKDMYPSMEIGYADHSSFDSEFAIKSNEYAYLLGATYFEKHITIDPGKERLDFQSALGEENVKQLIENLNYLDQQVFRFSKGDLRKIEEPELTYRNRQKVVVAKTDLKVGEIITNENTLFKMTQSGEGEQSISTLFNKQLINSVDKDVAILLTDVQ